jgi:membrane-associated phospholipid phosphatase
MKASPACFEGALSGKPLRSGWLFKSFSPVKRAFYRIWSPPFYYRRGFLKADGSEVSRGGHYDVAYLYVTGIYAVIITLIPIFRGSFVIPWVLPMWAALFLFYRYSFLPEWYKFLLNGIFLAGCYTALGAVASTFTGTYHGMDVLALEERIFGVLPCRWLQSTLRTPGCVNWYDYPLAFFHSLFFCFPSLAPWLIYRKNGLEPMKKAILAFALILTAGYITYILWPLTPPWLLAQEGLIAPLDRCVFHAIQNIVPGFMISGVSNTPRAAMPSLHAGVTLLMALTLNKELGFKKAWWSVLMLIAICFEIIYGAEHFVIDIIAGFAFACAAFFFAYRFPRKWRKD